MLKSLASITPTPRIIRYSLFLLTLLLIATGSVLALNSAQAQSANGVYDTDGDGLIEVSNLAQLDAIRYDPAGEGSPSADNRAAYYGAFPGAVAGMGCPNGDCDGYELVADLDFDTNGSGHADAGDAYWNNGAGWEPIGYRATFDGDGHTIANLFINRTNQDHVGLFGSATGVIRNIGLLAANVTGRNNVGGLVGSSGGIRISISISDSHATGAVTGSGDNVGGLVGSSRFGSISGSYATGAVTGSGDNVGGLVGSSRSISISDSHATGSVTGSGDKVGGLVGYGERFGSISSSYATGAVTGSGDKVGGLVGSFSGDISGSYATGTVTGVSQVGGLVGSFSGSGIRISDSHATGTVTGVSQVGGLVGSIRGSFISISDSHATGAVTGSGDNVGGLVGFGEGYRDDSGSSSISNSINISNSYATGTVAGVSQVGGLVGYGRGRGIRISDSHATGAVTGSGDNVGGLVGDGAGSPRNRISGSYATGAVTGVSRVGGLVGYGEGFGSISSSYATGAVTGSGDNVGGLVGSSSTVISISGSYATGTVAGVSQVGGLVGYGRGPSTRISSSYATGTVTGSGDNVGGLVGSIGGSSIRISDSHATGTVTGVSQVGGLVGSIGRIISGSISGSYATGAVTGSGDNVGGLVGSSGSGSISESYATGAVTGEFNVGGLVGGSSGSISASYATGYVSGDGAIGGLVGSSTGTTTHSYWDTETSGQDFSDGGSGKTTSELQSPTGATGIYSIWDPRAWDFGDSSQYPALKADVNGDGVASWQEFGEQVRVATITVALSLDGSPPRMIRIGSPVPVTATFSKAVSGFTVDDVTVANGTVSNFVAAAGGMVYTFDVTSSDIARVTVDIAADVAMDADGNGNAAATQLSFTPYDDDVATITVALSLDGSPPRMIRIGSPVPVTATFSKAVSGFTVDDVTVANGTVSNFVAAAGGMVYTFDVTSSDIARVTVDIAADVAMDADGNGNAAATQLSFTPYDDDVATITVALSLDGSPPRMIRIGSPVPVTATFSKAVSGFTVDDVTVANGTVSNFVAAAGGMVYTFDVTSSDIARVTVDIAADVAMDADGNGNAAATQLSFTPYDDDVATITVALSLDGSPPRMIRIGSPVPVTATFSKAVSGFTVDDVTVANGTVSNFVAAAGGMVYTFDVTSSDIARVTVDIAADVAMDADGNGHAAATQLSFTPYDDDGVPGISRAEVIAAIQDYFSGKLTRAQAIAVIQRYFASWS